MTRASYTKSIERTFNILEHYRKEPGVSHGDYLTTEDITNRRHQTVALCAIADALESINAKMKGDTP